MNGNWQWIGFNLFHLSAAFGAWSCPKLDQLRWLMSCDCVKEKLAIQNKLFSLRDGSDSQIFLSKRFISRPMLCNLISKEVLAELNNSKSNREIFNWNERARPLRTSNIVWLALNQEARELQPEPSAMELIQQLYCHSRRGKSALKFNISLRIFLSLCTIFSHSTYLNWNSKNGFALCSVNRKSQTERCGTIKGDIN